ncbi:MAPEG family protein [Shewanella canadensis]|uniref:MAPEG family protein n=1 Tax=Shewanella canadensis TaxID=271096 RepID=A0A3S0KWF6_9GAMM|nr:MAPEG family protein [Shewanella canadensis]RTR40042.1 MAPEG family protein [Shewanella canadensis]
MTTLLICLFIAMLLPYLAKGPVAVAMAKLGGYDNSHPREQQSRLTGFGARAVAAHQNAFESLLIFGLSVLAVIATQNVTDTTVLLAVVHVIARMVYQVLYLMDKGTQRSLSWFVAIFCSFGIFFQAF